MVKYTRRKERENKKIVVVFIVVYPMDNIYVHIFCMK